MSKKKITASADPGLAVQLQADAIAVGQDTYASTTVDLAVTAKVTGAAPKVKATGEVTAFAVAEAGEDGMSSTYVFTDAYSSDADKVKIRTKESSFEADGITYSYSRTTIKAWDSGKDQDLKVSTSTKHKELNEADIDIAGNLAIADFIVTAEGPNSYADAASYTFVEEDALSQSTTLTTAAVDVFF